MRLSVAQKRWLTVGGYLLFIYATLGIVGAPLRFLRAHGMLRISLLTCFLICFAGSLWIMTKTQTQRLWRYGVLIAVFAAALLITRQVKIPEEQVHFFEYGLVGILFMRALEPKMGLSWKTFGWALLLSAAAGVLDEGFQAIIPSRHFDVRDIFLNVLSGGLGLALYSAFPSENRLLNSSIQQKSAFRS